MKKLLPLILLSVILLYSCKKETDLQEPKKEYISSIDREALSHRLENTIFDSIKMKTYQGAIYDSCAEESINLSGYISYSIKETNINRDRFLLYMIDYTQLTGVGQETGIIYHGSGRVKDFTRVKEELLRLDTVVIPNREGEDSYVIDSIFTVTKVIARHCYKLTLTSIDRVITFIQNDLYKEINGEIIIEDLGNPIIETCKYMRKYRRFYPRF